MPYVIVRGLLMNKGHTPLDIMTLKEWETVVSKLTIPDLLEVVAETDTMEEAEALSRLLPKRNEEWINDKK